MEINELIESAVRNYLTNDVILKETIREVLYETFNYEIKQCVQEEISRQMKEKGKSYIEEEINKCLSMGIIVGDGWNKPKEYTFDEFIKEELHKQFTDKYSIQSKMQEMIKDSVRRRYDEFIKNNSSVLAEVILKNVVNK